MLELTLATAFAAGLLGSAHCVAMCGGIVTALAAGGELRAARTWLPLLYQCGRVLGYTLGGALAGAVGLAVGVGAGIALAHWSAVLRLATSVIIVVIGLDLALGGSARVRWLRGPERFGAALWRRLSPQLRGLRPRQPAARALVVGLLWGWMPCGLVYSTLLAAAMAGSALRGAAVMIAFGLGTLPAMLVLNHAGARLPRRDGAFASVLGAVIVACGLWTAAMPLMELSGNAHHAAGMTGAGSMSMSMP